LAGRLILVLNWLSWYFTIEILGLSVFPIAIFLFPKLEDKGYFFSKVIGLFLWGYLYWLLTSLGFLRNSLSGILITLIIGIAIILITTGFVILVKIIRKFKVEREP